MNMKQKYFWILGIVAVLGIISISIYFVFNQEETCIKPPMRTKLYKGNFSVSATPILNSIVELYFNLESIDDVPNTSIKLFLPEGIELVSGNLIWSDDIKKGEKSKHKVSIKVVKEGEWQIRAWVENEKFSGFNRAFFACLVSDENSGELLKSCPTHPSTKQSIKSQ